MKMTITMDGAPDDFIPMLASMGIETSPPPPELPDSPVVWFRSKLKAAGLHNEDLAAAVGLTPSTLSARVRGRTPWTLTEAITTCGILGADLSEFVHFFGNTPTQ